MTANVTIVESPVICLVTVPVTGSTAVAPTVVKMIVNALSEHCFTDMLIFSGFPVRRFFVSLSYVLVIGPAVSFSLRSPLEGAPKVVDHFTLYIPFH